MGRSRRGNHSNDKGSSKSKKSDTINKNPGQMSINNPDGPEHFKGKNALSQSSIDSAMTRSSSKNYENEMEGYLFIKLDRLYTQVKDCLLKSGYREADVEKAILSNGNVIGPRDPLNNVLVNSVAFLEEKVEEKGEAFKDTRELYTAMREALISSVMRSFPNMQRSDAIWHLLVKSWGSAPSITMTSDLHDGDQNRYDNVNSDDVRILDSSSAQLNAATSLSERIRCTPEMASFLQISVPIIAASIRREIGDPVIMQKALPSVRGELREGYDDIVDSFFLASTAGCSYEECLNRWLETNPDDPRIMQIDNLVKDIRQLQEKVKEQKEWAQQKVIDCAKRLSKDLQELNILRLEKVNMDLIKQEKQIIEKAHALKIKEKEESMKMVNCQAKMVIGAKKDMEIENAKIRANTEAIKLNVSEYNDRIKEVLKKEKKSMKKLADVEKQIQNIRAQCDEENQRVLQLEQEVIQAEKEAEDAEMVDVGHTNLVSLYEVFVTCTRQILPFILSV